jgi:hypothetical protein
VSTRTRPTGHTCVIPAPAHTQNYTGHVNDIPVPAITHKRFNKKQNKDGQTKQGTHTRKSN